MSEPSLPPRRLIEWTGERCVPWVDDWQVLYEHLHRYYFAADLADGKRVLDLGSGEGYGSAILAQRAKEVLAVEVDPQAVAHATANYPLENLHFRLSSVLDLDDLRDASFDLVVCYEVIEHIVEHEELLALVRRVLTPDGLFVVSSPDREIYSEAAGYHNPFHVKELSRVEFDQLLTSFFAHHALWSQSVISGSTLRQLDQPLKDSWVDEILVRRDGEGWVRRESGPVPYMVAVASNDPLPVLPHLSLLNEPDGSAVRASSASVGVIPSENGAGWVSERVHHLYQLWEPERLLRQVEIFDDAMSSEMHAHQQARMKITHLRAAHDRAVVAREKVRAAHDEAVAGRDEALAALEAYEALKDEMVSVKSELREIKESRAWRALARYRRVQERMSPRSRRSGT